MIFRKPLENTTLETRVESEKSVDKQKRYSQILEILGDRLMTAKEIAHEMYKKGMIPTSERNFVSPRATEMLYDGRLEIVGKKKCDWTGKTVTVYKRRNENGD